jgi:type IV secretion system protein VirB9
MKLNVLTLTTAIVTGATLLLGGGEAHAAKKPNSLVTDNRVKQVAYDPNQVYEVVGTYGYQTSIEFDKSETIKVVTLGDSIAWQTVPYENRLFLKPVEPNAATNLTVITDKRTYYFKLSSSRSRSTMTFLVRFVYPNSNIHVLSSQSGVTRRNVVFDLSSLNLDYGVSGDKHAIQLTKAFDDGQFTYFDFEDNADIPTIYAVGPDGTESLVNTRREGNYLVVERTVALFTLRNGTSYLCVQNNAIADRRTVAQPNFIEGGA